MLTIVVELFIEGMDGSYIANKLAWVIEPAIVLCIPHSRRLVTRRVFSNILPLSVTVGCQINSFVNVVRICERRCSVKFNQGSFPNIKELSIFLADTYSEVEWVCSLIFILIFVWSPIVWWWKLVISVQYRVTSAWLGHFQQSANNLWMSTPKALIHTNNFMISLKF